MKTLPEHRCFGRVESGTPNKNALRFVRLGSDIKTVAGKKGGERDSAVTLFGPGDYCALTVT